jgi:hypothetical protein
MRILCSIGYDEIENDEGHFIEGVAAICSRCGHLTESFGNSECSIRRCLALMRDECPEDESNFYFSDD